MSKKYDLKINYALKEVFQRHLEANPELGYRSVSEFLNEVIRNKAKEILNPKTIKKERLTISPFLIQKNIRSEASESTEEEIDSMIMDYIANTDSNEVDPNEIANIFDINLLQVFGACIRLKKKGFNIFFIEQENLFLNFVGNKNEHSLFFKT